MILVLSLCGAIQEVFAAKNQSSAGDNINFNNLLEQFDKADNAALKKLANQVFDKLNTDSFFDEPYSMPPNLPTDSIRAEVWSDAQIYYFNKQDFRKSIIYGKKALVLLRGGKDTEKLADCLSYLSAAYTRISDYTNAIRYAQEVLAIDRKAGNKSAISSDLSNIAAIYLSSRQPNQAKPFILEAIENSTAAGDSVRIAIQMGIASEVYQNLGDSNMALYYARRAYEIDSRACRNAKAAIRLCQMAAAQMALGRNEDARKSLLMALPELQTSGNQLSLNIAYNQLGSIALSSSQMAEAARYFSKAADYFQASGDMANECKARNGLYQALRNSNMPSAIANLERYCALKDSINSRDMRQALSEYDAKYRNEEFQNAIRYEQRMKRTIVWAAAGLFFLAVCAIILLLHVNRLRKQRNKIIRESEQSRTNFFTNITHEFRTPLTIIRGATTDALQHIDDNDRLRHDLNTISVHEQSLLNLTNQLLDIARLASKPIDEAPVSRGDIAAYIHMLCESCSLFAAQKDISIVYDAKPDKITADFIPAFIKRIVQNLVSNAIKFSHPGGTVQVKLTVEGSNLRLLVHDDGIGMTEEQKSRIFEPFYQASDNSSNIGTGIGLSLVSLTVKASKGNIIVDSAQGQGSTFVVTLPTDSGSTPINTFNADDFAPQVIEPVATTTLCDADDSAPNDVRILVVEDTPDIARYIARQLNPDYKYFFASDGAEGLRKAEDIVPDLIVTDVMMPLMDGFEFTRKTRESELLNHIPIIIVTAKATHNDRIEGLRAGADAYLEKPFHADELNIRAEKLMAQRRLLQQKFASHTTDAEKVAVNTAIAEVSPDIVQRSKRDQAFIDKFEIQVKIALATGKIDYDNVAYAMCLCRAQLNRKIKAITGMTMSDYILQIRINTAKSLLDTTDMSIAEVALKCGIDSPSYFSMVFKKATGMTPQQYKNRER